MARRKTEEEKAARARNGELAPLAEHAGRKAKSNGGELDSLPHLRGAPPELRQAFIKGYQDGDSR